MERTPLEKAKACCGKLHDKGTDKLLAAIAAAPDRDMTLAEAEAELSRHTRTFTVYLKRTWEIGTDVRSTEWSVCACREASKSDLFPPQSFGLFASTSLRRAVSEAIEYMRPAKLPTAHEVTEQIGDTYYQHTETEGSL